MIKEETIGLSEECLILWQSPDSKVVVVDGVAFPEEEEGCKKADADIDRLFGAGAWIIVWHAEGRPWRVTRSRNFEKPNLRKLRARDRWEGGNAFEAWTLFESGSAGVSEAADDRVAFIFGQRLYELWQQVAADALPGKIVFLGLDPDDYDENRIGGWLRPGIPLHREQRRMLREQFAA